MARALRSRGSRISLISMAVLACGRHLINTLLDEWLPHRLVLKNTSGGSFAPPEHFT